MKTMKKVMALMIACVMMFALAIPVMAAQSSSNTITVNNAKAGETYKAFKMLELFVDDTQNPTAYAYTVANDWAGFFADSNSAVWGTVLEKDATKTYFTAKSDVSSEIAWSSTSALSAFAEAAAKYAADNHLSPVNAATAEETTVTLNTTESGYYLVTSTLGTRAMIDTTPGNVTINEKNEGDTVDKTVKEDAANTYGDSNDAQIGDTVEFKTEVTIVPRSVKVKVHDTMSSGLTLDASSITVYSDAALGTEYTEATVRAGTGESAPDSGDTFTIEIPDTFAATATASQKLYIVYKAQLNSNAVAKDENGVSIVNQTNKTTVSFGDSTISTEDTTTTTTHKFSVHKYASDDKVNLANAIFRVKKNDEVVNLIKLDDYNYRVVDGTETSAPVTHVAANNEVAEVADNSVVSDFVTVADGDIVIWGVDSDEYIIEEIQAPKGYNMLNPATSEVQVNTDNNTKIEVKNQSGTELPSTGGIGTTIFYIIGAVLVVGAVVVLVTRRRMNARK